MNPIVVFTHQNAYTWRHACSSYCWVRNQITVCFKMCIDPTVMFTHRNATTWRHGCSSWCWFWSRVTACLKRCALIPLSYLLTETQPRGGMDVPAGAGFGGAAAAKGCKDGQADELT
eukprot:630373-Pelagomonas_calceolata.AAC.1